MTTTPSSPRTTRPNEPIAPVMLHIGTDVDDTIATDFERWCEVHVADNLRLPGFVSARRLRKNPTFSGPGASPGTLTLYQLEGESTLETPEYTGRKIGMPDRFTGHIGFERSLYRELGVPAGIRAHAIGPAILHVTVDVEPAWRERFVEWYVNVHVPAVLDAPGMLSVRRFENVELAAGGAPRPGQHTYCTLYEMEAADVIARPQTLASASRGACPPELAPHRVALNHTYEEIFRAAATAD